MTSTLSAPMPKLNTVLGFRPTDAELKTIEEAELATGRNRSDIMRACFHASVGHVVRALVAERRAALTAFEAALKETPVPYRIRTKEDRCTKSTSS